MDIAIVHDGWSVVVTERIGFIGVVGASAIGMHADAALACVAQLGILKRVKFNHNAVER